MATGASTQGLAILAWQRKSEKRRILYSFAICINFFHKQLFKIKHLFQFIPQRHTFDFEFVFELFITDQIKVNYYCHKRYY